MIVSPIVMEAETVKDPATFLEVVGNKISIVEPAMTTEVAIPLMVVETQAKMVKDSATPVIESILEDINIQTRELIIRWPMVVDQAAVEGTDQGHHDGGEATEVMSSDSQGTSSCSFNDEEELNLFLPDFFWCSRIWDFILEITRLSSTPQRYPRAHFLQWTFQQVWREKVEGLKKFEDPAKVYSIYAWSIINVITWYQIYNLEVFGVFVYDLLHHFFSFLESNQTSHERWQNDQMTCQGEETEGPSLWVDKEMVSCSYEYTSTTFCVLNALIFVSSKVMPSLLLTHSITRELSHWS